MNYPYCSILVSNLAKVCSKNKLKPYPLIIIHNHHIGLHSEDKLCDNDNLRVPKGKENEGNTLCIFVRRDLLDEEGPVHFQLC